MQTPTIKVLLTLKLFNILWGEGGKSCQQNDNILKHNFTVEAFFAEGDYSHALFLCTRAGHARCRRTPLRGHGKPSPYAPPWTSCPLVALTTNQTRQSFASFPNTPTSFPYTYTSWLWLQTLVSATAVWLCQCLVNKHLLDRSHTVDFWCVAKFERWRYVILHANNSNNTYWSLRRSAVTKRTFNRQEVWREETRILRCKAEHRCSTAAAIPYNRDIVVTSIALTSHCWYSSPGALNL